MAAGSCFDDVASSSTEFMTAYLSRIYALLSLPSSSYAISSSLEAADEPSDEPSSSPRDYHLRSECMTMIHHLEPQRKLQDAKLHQQPSHGIFHRSDRTYRLSWATRSDFAIGNLTTSESARLDIFNVVEDDISARSKQRAIFESATYFVPAKTTVTVSRKSAAGCARTFATEPCRWHRIQVSREGSVWQC